MTITRYSAIGLISLGLFGLPACGNDDAKSDVQTDDRSAELEAQISALEELIRSGAGNLEELQKALEEAQARLAELETCENGGECAGRAENLKELTALTDAYCEWLFGCCSEEEATIGMGPAFANLQACQDTLSSQLETGRYLSLRTEGSNQSTYFLSNILHNVLNSAAAMSQYIEAGKVSINSEKLAECVSLIEAEGCNTARQGCVDYTKFAACEGFLDGHQQEGASCSNTLECEIGLICDVDSGYGLSIYGNSYLGNCVQEPAAGDPCSNYDHCSTRDQDLYCDPAQSVCVERPKAGEACEFEDPSFFEGLNTKVPCAPGYECSLESKTCVAPCSEGARCYTSSSVLNYCEAGLMCNATDSREGTGLETNYTSIGFCDAPKDGGTPANHASECKTGTLSDGECTKEGGDSCVDSAECASGLCSTGSCSPICSPYDGYTDDCGENSYCEGSVCLPKIALGNSCPNLPEGACADDHVCAGGTCMTTVGSGGDCEGSFGHARCPADEYCNYSEGATPSGYVCTPRSNQGESCEGTESCGPGLFCDNSTCLPPSGRENGSYCDYFDQCASERCVDGTCGLGIPEGDPCSDTDVYGSYDQECEKGTFCRPDAPQSGTGICTAQLSPGEVCDGSLPYDALQCEGDVNCNYASSRNIEVCPIVYEEEPDSANACIIYGLPWTAPETPE